MQINIKQSRNITNSLQSLFCNQKETTLDVFVVEILNARSTERARQILKNALKTLNHSELNILWQNALQKKIDFKLQEKPMDIFCAALESYNFKEAHLFFSQIKWQPPTHCSDFCLDLCVFLYNQKTHKQQVMEEFIEILIKHYAAASTNLMTVECVSKLKKEISLQFNANNEKTLLLQTIPKNTKPLSKKTKRL